MWLYICLGATIAGLLFTNTGKNVIKFGDILFVTVKDRYLNKKKDIKIININNKNMIIHEDLILITSKSHKNYDIVCFHSESNNLVSQDVILNHDINGECKKILPTSIVKHGTYISTIPFRPSDFNFKHLFIAIKNDDKQFHNIYKFREKEYINLVDIIHKYEDDLKNSTRKIIFAEAFD